MRASFEGHRAISEDVHQRKNLKNKLRKSIDIENKQRIIRIPLRQVLKERWSKQGKVFKTECDESPPCAERKILSALSSLTIYNKTICVGTH